MTPKVAWSPVGAAAAVALLVALGAPGAAAQSRTPQAPGSERPATPGPRDHSRPEERHGRPPQDRSGGGPTGDDVVEDQEGGGTARGVIRPPAGMDPGIHGAVPDPTPRTTPVIPPPGTPGGDPNVIPR